MLKLFIVGSCVMASTLAAARERRPPLTLSVTPATRALHLLAPAVPIVSDTELRIEDMTGQATNTVTSLLENMQHLGSKYRTWLWITPSVGYVKGGSIRVDFP
jgi:hypothetical protein